MARTYDIDIVDSNDNTVAFFQDLDEAGMNGVLTKIVLVSGYFINLRVHLRYEDDDEHEYVPGAGVRRTYAMPKDWGNRPFSKEPF